MKRTSAVVGTVVAVAAGMWAVPLQAQGGPGFGGAGGPHMGRSIEIALENQEELGLTGEQVSQLREMKGILDSEVTPLADEMKALRERIRSGELDRAEGLREMEALRGELITASAPLRGRVEEVFSVTQHRQLQALVQPRRGAAGQGGMMRGRGRGGVAPGAFPGRGGVGLGQGAAARGFRGAGLGLGQGATPRGIRGAGVARGFRQGPVGVPTAPRARALRSWRGVGS